MISRCLPTRSATTPATRDSNRAGMNWNTVRTPSAAGESAPGKPIERLVARTRVDPGTLNVVRLDCTLAELGKMQPLNVQERQQTKAGSGQMAVVDSERAPDGTGVLRLDQKVEATNGTI